MALYLFVFSILATVVLGKTEADERKFQEMKRGKSPPTSVARNRPNVPRPRQVSPKEDVKKPLYSNPPKVPIYHNKWPSFPLRDINIIARPQVAHDNRRKQVNHSPQVRHELPRDTVKRGRQTQECPDWHKMSRSVVNSRCELAAFRLINANPKGTATYETLIMTKISSLRVFAK